jgi:hypothetical protein
MPKRVFVSYCWKQGDWVWDRLVPCLKAGGAEVLIDREQFEAARALNRQMDKVQDRADLSILVFSPDYLTSPPCVHEMKRAVDRDPEFESGVTIPVKLVECDLPDEIRRPNPLYVDLRDDQRSDQWDLLLSKCEAELGTLAPQWLKARDDVRQFLSRGESVNLTVQGKPQWRSLIDDLRLRGPALTRLGTVDLEDPVNYSRQGLVESILAACSSRVTVPAKPHDLVALGRAFRGLQGSAYLALTRFDHVAHREDYEIDLFAALRYEMECKKLVLLIQSRAPFLGLLPADHPMSSINVKTVELRGRS